MALHRIQVLVETDDGAWVDALGDRIQQLVCPHDVARDHACPVPWFILVSEVPEDEADGLRDLLNR